jgi:predicted transcriptional regulator
MSNKLDDEIYKKFMDLANDLSPENLACDGEASQDQIEKEYARIMKSWRSLEVIAGRKVTEDEIWQRYYDETRAALQ